MLQLDQGSAEGDTGSKVASAMAVLQKKTGDDVESDKDLVRGCWSLLRLWIGT